MTRDMDTYNVAELKVGMARYKERLIVVLFIVLPVLLVLAPALSAKFVLLDDHAILTLSSDSKLHPQLTGGKISFLELMPHEIAIGRFRPVLASIFYPLARTFGPRPALWHGLYVILAITSAVLLYGALRGMGLDILCAIIGVNLAILDRSGAINWIHIGTAESCATFFLCLALYPAAHPRRGTEWIFFLSLFLMAATKESYILAIPAVYAVRLLAKMFQRELSFTVSLRRECVAGLFSATLTLAMLFITLYVAHQAGANSNGGESLAPVGGMTAYMTNARSLLASRPGLWVAGVFGLCACLFPRFSGKRWPAGILMLILLGAVPQVLLYSTRDTSTDRYFYPQAVFEAIAIAMGLQHLQRKPLLYYPAASIAALVMLLCWNEVNYKAQTFRANSIALSEMIDFIVKNTPQNRSVGILTANNAYEKVISLITHLGWRGMGGHSMVLLPTSKNGSPDSPGFDVLKTTYFITQTFPVEIVPADVATVACLVSNPQDDALLVGFDVKEFCASKTKLEFVSNKRKSNVPRLKLSTKKETFRAAIRREDGDY